MVLAAFRALWRRATGASELSDQALPQDTEGSVYQFIDAPPRSLALVALLDKDGAQIEVFLTRAAAQMARFDRVVYLVNTSDLRPFTRRGAIVEVLVDRQSLALTHESRSPATYLRFRYGFVLQKWRPDWVLSYGTDIDKYLATTHGE